MSTMRKVALIGVVSADEILIGLFSAPVCSAE